MTYFCQGYFYRDRLSVFIIFLFVFFTLSPLGLALDPQKKITQYMHDVWGIKDGLPQATVETIIQTRDCYLWLGTQGGLARFDGVRLRIFDKRNVEQILNNSIKALCEDREGNLWIGTIGGGLTCLNMNNGKFTTYTTGEGLANDRIMSIYEDREGSLWIGTDGGVSRLDRIKKNGKFTFTTYTTKEGLADNLVRAICEDQEGNLWIGTYGGGLNRLKNGKFTTYTTKDGLAENRINSIYEDNNGDGGLWIGTEGGGLNRFKDGKFSKYITGESLSASQVLVVYKDREGSLWIGTYEGLLRMDRKNGNFTRYTTKEGLSDDIVRSIYEDREGSLWVGTHTGGVNRLKDGKFTTYSTEEGLSNDIAWSIYEDTKGSLWIGTEAGLNRLDPHKKDGKFTFTVYTTKEGLSNDRVKSIYEDTTGNLWIGTRYGLNCLDRRKKNGKFTFTVYTTNEGLSNNFVRSLYVDREGNLWIGTENGLNLLNRQKKDGKFTFSVFRTKEGLTSNSIMNICEDREGNLWLGTQGGLHRLNRRKKDDKFTFTRYTTEQGLSNNVVMALYEDREENLWIGTYGGGLNRLKHGKFTHITVNEGLFDDVVFMILEDEKGNFWMSCNKGIFRVSKKELNDFCQGKRRTVNCISYNEKDGMKSRECSGSTYPNRCKRRDGEFWFPTIRGVVKIDPNHIKINRLPPPVTIEKIFVDNRKIQTYCSLNKEKMVLSPGTEGFEIQYTGLSLLVPEKVRFKYKLEGFDKAWRQVGTRRTAYYTKIPPGDYIFRVNACNNDGIWNETGDAISFYLEPYFYQTWWFYMICVLGVMFLTVGIYRLRVKHLQKRKRELEKANEIARKEREIAQREREIADAANRAKSEFLARMSHELRTPMNAVIGFADMLINTGLTAEQLDYVRIIRRSSEALTLLLKDILDFSRLEAGELDMISSDFDPKMTALNVYEIVRPRLENKLVEMRCHIGDNVPAYVKGDGGRFQQVLLNLLSNAAKFTKKGEIELSLHVEKEQKERIKFHVRVRDTGIGIPGDKLEVIFDVFHQADGSDTRRYGGSGVGLSIARQIAKLMGGNVWAESVPGKGSIFHFTAWMDKSGKKSEKEIIPGHPAEKKIPTAGENKHPAHILLVEDNPINRKLAFFILTKAGYRLTAVNDGKKAVDVYTSGPDSFDLILMDIQMPVMDGREATRKIREIESSVIKDQPAARKWHIPIIAITALNMPGDREKCIKAGMDDYIAKPIKAEVVLKTVKKWVSKNRPS